MVRFFFVFFLLLVLPLCHITPAVGSNGSDIASSGCNGPRLDPNSISRIPHAVGHGCARPNTCQRECHNECPKKEKRKCQIDTLSQYTHLYVDKPFNDFNAFNIKQDSGAWVLIFEGFWVLKMVFEWCRIHIKMVFAQHYSLVVFYPILLWFKYALFIQANPVQVGPGPPKSAQVLPGPRPGIPQPSPPRFSEKIPETPQNRRK